MGAVYFYHLTRRPLEQALPSLLGKAGQADWRVELRGTRPERMAWLDERLWLGAEAGFLPHGLAGGPHDALQPVLLTLPGQAAANAPDCVISVDGAEIAAAEIAGLARACILFDGNDAGALDHARRQWANLTGAGCAAQYWSEDSGGWQKKAERPAGAQDAPAP